MRVKPLTSLIIEPTNTCNLRCSFCFVTEGMTRDEGFMDLVLFPFLLIFPTSFYLIKAYYLTPIRYFLGFFAWHGSMQILEIQKFN